jgi:hypothetical protein
LIEACNLLSRTRVHGGVLVLFFSVLPYYGCSRPGHLSWEDKHLEASWGGRTPFLFYRARERKNRS